MKISRTPGQRAGLTRADVVTCARELLDEEGAARLTMRELASRLGVAPNALYSHVASKTALIDEVLDDVLGGVDPPAADVEDPVTGLESLMRSTLRLLLAHPGLVPLYVDRHGARGPNAHRLGDLMLVLLDRAGVVGEEAREARTVLIVYTIGFAAFGRSPPFELEPPGAVLEAFERGLRWLLTGITTRPT